jgi:hypothetical protein
MAYLRMPFCSPYKVLWPLVTTDAQPSSVVHRAYARYVWTMHPWYAAPRAALYCVSWPLLFAYLSWKYTRRLGKRVRDAVGKSLLQQVVEQFSVALFQSISPKKYYVFELFRPERLRNARHYIMRYELKGGLHNLLESRIENPSRPILNDKEMFFEHCREQGVESAPIYLIVRKAGELKRSLPFEGLLPEMDLFVKPLRGRGGRGCEKWYWQGDGRYQDSNGTVLSAADLLARFQRQVDEKAAAVSSCPDLIVQEAMRPHEGLQDLSLNVLTSCRIMSMRNEHGGFEVTHAVFKSSTNPRAIVDNFHKGGIVSYVNVATGELGPASDAGVISSCIWHDVHPLSGARIAGRCLPQWSETVELVRRAHAAFPDRVIVGWDVAITDRGPVIIEGNVQSGCDMIQRTHDLPAGIGRMAECYAYHVTHAFERAPSLAWTIRENRAKARQASNLAGLPSPLFAFWAGWAGAVLLLAVALGMAGWLISHASSASVATSGGIAVMLILAGALYLARRGTASLKGVLARNLAIVIAIDLEELRRSIGAGGVEATAANLEARRLEVPAFFGSRREIRGLLGPVTERTLVDILAGLRAYNEALDNFRQRASAPASLSALPEELRRQVGHLHDHIRQALSLLAPYRHPTMQ